jgi:hypothetical protein
VTDRGEPLVSCSEWHGDGTAGENDRDSGLAATLPLGRWVGPRPGRREPRWQALRGGPGRLVRSSSGQVGRMRLLTVIASELREEAL